MIGKKIKILITAGHAATTALSLFEEIRDKKPEWQVMWIGTKKAIEGKSAVTLEHKIFSNLDVKSYSITSGRLQRKLTFWTIPSLLKAPVGFFQAMAILIREKPDVIVSFGGHVSFPVTVSGFILGIPIVVHEQTSGAGLANRIESKFATRVGISRRSSFELFPKGKTTLVGNLIRKEIAKVKPKVKISNPPVIYFTGGSRGSQVINQTLDDSLEMLLKNYKVIHQTGEVDFKYFSDRRSGLPPELSKNYIVKGSFDSKEVSDIFSKADIVVSRAGANTVSELIVTRKPSILIPIPWVQNNEQEKNARIAEEIGLSTTIKEADLSSDTLVAAIANIKKNWQKISKNSSEEIENLDRNASSKLLGVIESCLTDPEGK